MLNSANSRTRLKNRMIKLIFKIVFAFICISRLCLGKEFTNKPTESASRNFQASFPYSEIQIEDTYLKMSDGVRLAATFYTPKKAMKKFEKDSQFPVLLEMLPYRKDDSFLARDYSLYSYFVKSGFIVVKVDVRGTGGSEGVLPEGEYSDRELEDAVEIIDQLSKLKNSNGNVGMFGISWSGFNAILTATRKPPALKAILAADASDDLFHDDVHFIDGAFHVDEYEFTIDHENALPMSPEYKLDENYFKNRFEQPPCFLIHKKKSTNSKYWRKKSLKYFYSKLKTPTFLIGGLLDGYRDSVPRMLKHVRAPMIAQIGPWNHAWPDNGEPGPNYEWRAEAVKWWKIWLGDLRELEDPAGANEPIDGKRKTTYDYKTRKNHFDRRFPLDERVLFFIRDTNEPDKNQKMTKGYWSFEQWPPKNEKRKKFYLSAQKLNLEIATSLSGGERYKDFLYSKAVAKNNVLEHQVNHGSGLAAGFWWGEPTGDMANETAGALVFESAPLTPASELVGFPNVSLNVQTESNSTNWIVRLEDVFPDGSVALVTGAIKNANLENDFRNRRELKKSEWIKLNFNLHFTTWTFKPGHKIRVVISNAQFPMVWPTPRNFTSRLKVNNAFSKVELPLREIQNHDFLEFAPISEADQKSGQSTFKKRPQLLPPVPRENRPDLPEGKGDSAQSSGFDSRTKEVYSSWKIDSKYYVLGANFFSQTLLNWKVPIANPEQASFLGEGTYEIKKDQRNIRLETKVLIKTEKQRMKINFVREIYEENKLIRRKQWTESSGRL